MFQIATTLILVTGSIPYDTCLSTNQTICANQMVLKEYKSPTLSSPYQYDTLMKYNFDEKMEQLFIDIIKSHYEN